MRKFTLMLAFIAFTSMIYAQKAACGSINLEGPNDAQMVQHLTKASGDIIWSEDFNGDKWKSTVVVDDKGYLFNTAATLPEGWKFVDNNNLDYYWHWSDVGPRGGLLNADGACDNPRTDWLARLPEGTTVDNGFMLLESNWFNTTEACEVSSNETNMDTYIEFGPIDFSNVEGAVFNMRNYYIYCCEVDAAMNLEISKNYNPADGTGDWDESVLLSLEDGNEWTIPEHRDLHINLSKIVPGNKSVYFRIHVTLAAHYFWLIDDINFYEPPVNDLILSDGFADYIYNADEIGVDDDLTFNFWGGYTEIPQEIVSNFVQFRGAVEGNGTADANNAIITAEILKDAAVVETLTSTPKTIYSFTKDTLKIEADYTPADLAHYQVSMTLSMDAVDEKPEDNTWSYEFDVTNKARYSRVRHGMEDNFDYASPHNWGSGGADGDIMVQRFTIPESAGTVKVKGVSVWIDDYSGDSWGPELAAIEAGSYTMIARMYKWDSETEARVDMDIASNLFTLQISDTATWIQLDFKDNGKLALEPDRYWAGIEVYTGNEDLYFNIGKDALAPKQPISGGLVYLVNAGGWYRTGHNYAIDLNFNFETQYDLTFNVDMSTLTTFDPATEKVFVEGTFGEKVELTSTDNVNYSVAVKAVAGSYTYNYITSSDAKSIDYTVVVDGNVATEDVFKLTSLTENTLGLVSMYPNPFNGTLTVENLGNASQIMVSNVLGQTVMTVSVTENRMDLNTDNLEKGIYLITIVDNNNNSRTERVVKK